MKIEAHILARNEVDIFTYSARHYTSFCSKVVLHDMGSTDGTLEVARLTGVEVRHWDTKDQMDDRVNTTIKNTAWIGTDADWCIVVDVDEFIYFPSGVTETLSAYESQNLFIAKPRGWEMFNEAWPTTAGQIYDEVKMGGRDDKWYSKPVIFNPRIVDRIEFEPGAHGCESILKNGNRIATPASFSTPECLLLHCHHIGPIEKIAWRYDDHRRRMCQNNIDHNWGNVHDSGIKHAQDKRNAILSRLERVVA